MPSTIYQVFAREYVSSTPIVQSYNSFQSKLLYGSVAIIGVAAGYLYMTGQLFSDTSDMPVVADL